MKVAAAILIAGALVAGCGPTKTKHQDISGGRPECAEAEALKQEASGLAPHLPYESARAGALAAALVAAGRGVADSCLETMGF